MLDLLGMTDDPEPSGAKPAAQTGTLDLSAIMPFALQLKEQGDIEKIKDATDIFKSSIAVLERAVAAQGMA